MPSIFHFEPNHSFFQQQFGYIHMRGLQYEEQAR